MTSAALFASCLALSWSQSRQWVMGQVGHNCRWVTWVMGHCMLIHDPLPFTAYVFILWICTKASSGNSGIISRMWKTFQRIQCTQHHYNTAEQHVSWNRTNSINCTWGLQKESAEINCTCANMHSFGFDLSDCMQSNCYGHRKCNTIDSIHCFWRFNNLKQVNFYIYLGIG